MFRFFETGFTWAIVLIAYSLPASGDIITFDGQFTSGSGSLLGDVPPLRKFNVLLNFDSGLNGIGIINSGSLTFSQSSLSITGGNIFVSDFGAMDQATLLFNTSSPNGSLSLSLFGSAINDNLVNQSNLNALLRVGSPAAITANFGSEGSYTGTISAVPEPSSVALLAIGIMIIGVGYRMRAKNGTPRFISS